MIPSLIHSQKTLPSNSVSWDSTEVQTRPISYFRLNELFKFVEYKYKFADPSIEYKNKQILFLDSLIIKKDLIIDQYENTTIPALEGRVRVKDSTIRNQFIKHGAKEAILDAKLHREKKKRFGVGFSIGYGFAPITDDVGGRLKIKTVPNVNISINYNIIKF